MVLTGGTDLISYVSIPLAIGLAYTVYKNKTEKARKRALAQADASDYGEEDPNDQDSLPPHWDPIYLLTNRRAAAVRLDRELAGDMDAKVELKLRTLQVNYNNFQPENQILGTDF